MNSKVCALLIILSMLFPGCLKSGESKESNPPAEAQNGEPQIDGSNGEGGIPDENKGRNTESLPDDIQEAGSDKPSEKQAAMAGFMRKLNDRHALLAADEVSAVIPKEYKLGPLQDYFTTISGEKVILGTADLAFRKLRSGIVPDEEIHPEYITETSRDLALYMERELLPSSWRIGRVNIADKTSASINVMFTGNAGKAYGEVYFGKYNNEWYITVFNVNFFDMEVQNSDDFNDYTPSEYYFR